MEAEDKAVVADCGSPSAVEGKFTFFSCPVDEESKQKMTPLASFNTPGLAELVHFNAIAGSQRIEMYQCIETKEKEDVPTEASLVETHAEDENDEKEEQESRGKGKRQRQEQATLSVRSEASGRRRRSDGEEVWVYKYHMGWADTYYNSHEFKGTPGSVQHAGCPDFVYDNQVNHNPAPPDRGDGTPCELGRQLVHATNIEAGGFTIGDEEELKKLDATQAVEISPFEKDFSLNPHTDNIVSALSSTTMGHHAGQPNYISSCNEARLGCVRISWNQSETSHISVLGKAGGSGVMEKMSISSAWGCGEQNFMRMSTTEMTKEEMISEMKGENSLKTWLYRIGGLLCAWLSLFCCFQPVSNAADSLGNTLNMIPFFGNLFESAFEGMVDMFLCIISCSAGLSCGLLVIGIVWLGMRPIIGGPLVGGCIVLFAIGAMASKKAERDPRKMRVKAVQEPYGEHAPLAGEYEDEG